MKTAIELIEEERARQRSLGFDAAHDDEHSHGELAVAAMCYAREASLWNNGHAAGDCGDHWPFEDEAWRPAEDPRRNIAKSIALLIAEHERLDRVLQTGQESTPGIFDLAARYDYRDGTFDPEPQP